MPSRADTLPTEIDARDIAVTVEQLKEETRLLRAALDELRDDVVWAARQVLSAGYAANGTPPPPARDPLTGEQAFTDDAPHAEETAESGPYCCDNPKLSWFGHPDAPGVGCEHCGFVIAENGSVFVYDGTDEVRNANADEAPSPAAPHVRESQGMLF